MAQLVKHLTSAQVMISGSVGLSPMSGSVLTAQSLEPASGSVSPSLSSPPSLLFSLSKINKYLKIKERERERERESERGRDKEGERIPSRESTLSVWSQMLMNPEIMT